MKIAFMIWDFHCNDDMHVFEIWFLEQKGDKIFC